MHAVGTGLFLQFFQASKDSKTSLITPMIIGRPWEEAPHESWLFHPGHENVS